MIKLISLTIIITYVSLPVIGNTLLEKRARWTKSSKPVLPRYIKNNTLETTATITATAPLNRHTRVLQVYPSEFPKFFALSFMMFFIVFIFTLTRDTKDALIVTNCGAEAIAFLKVYGVLPAATLFMIGYSWMTNIYAPRALFRITLAPFLAFYTLFAFVLYPMRHQLHPMHIPLPEGGSAYAVNLLRHWTYSLYYIVSELWSSTGLPLLFWSCANDVININEAKRIYPLVTLIGNLGPICSGLTMTLVSNKVTERIHDDDSAFEVSLKILTSFMICAGGLVYVLHWLVHDLDDKENKEDDQHSATNDQLEATMNKQNIRRKNRPSFYESIKVLGSNHYLRNIATMVLSYGLTIEFTEIMWKSAVKRAFPIKTDYLRFMGACSTMVGVSAFLMMFVGAHIVNILGWRAGALLTPGIMALLAIPFFTCIIFGGLQSHSSTMLVVYIGLVLNVLSKATKYAIFDPTKEMTFIPLDQESKTKGKAAIDVLGARLGKSAGALAQQILVLIFGSITAGAPAVTALFYFVTSFWIGAVNELSHAFTNRAAETREDKIHEKSSNKGRRV
mmetsp:Transcript_7520/g.12498  ORF Transcript_7520/g.12498 Transcript_7520/m.12498 type:complete len:562 (-) Transcript_7520:899-2584(-)